MTCETSREATKGGGGHSLWNGHSLGVYRCRLSARARVPTADDAPSVDHEVQGVAGHVGHGDTQQLLGGVRVPHSDVILGAGGEELRRAAGRETRESVDV